MATTRVSIHGEWSSKLAFVLAATGSAVGLGNIWKFPYITGENGGGAFVLLYLGCILLFGLPIMMAEVLLGRRGRQSPINTMRTLADEEGLSKAWGLLGWLGVLAGFLILSYYSVIAGWALSYVFRTASGVFVDATADGVSSIFSQLVGSAETLLAWHTLFMVMTVLVIARGVESGIERAVTWLMPGLFVLLLVLVGYSMTNGNFEQAIHFLFTPDFSKLTPNSVLVALGQAFFTLSLGMGAIMIYGSYLPQDASIAKTSFSVAMADTVVAVLAGMAIFPIVFSNGLEPSQGAGLIFNTLPIAFGQMPGGTIFGSLFFLLLVFAAWTSAISLLEPAVTWLVENQNMRRVRASVICGALTWLVGLGTIFSFNIWADFKFLDRTVFDLLDYLTSNIMLPLGGLLIAIFVAWRMRHSSIRQELAMGNGIMFQIWFFLTRFVAPAGVILIFLNIIGVFG